MEVLRKSSDDFTRIFDIVSYQRSKYPNARALNGFVNGAWRSLSIDELEKRAEVLACWFLEQGFQKGDRILIVPVNGSPEWMIVDFACQQAGLIVVPVHPTSREDEISLIISETESRMCICADVALYYKFSSVATTGGYVLDVRHLDRSEKNYFKPIGLDKATAEWREKLSEVRNSILPTDMLTILYTSGSSGVPKGVMLSHQNVVSSIKSIITLLPLEAGQRVISFLPFSHIFERVACYAYLVFGVSIYFNQNKDTFTHDFATVRPHFCTSVPRVLEKMYDFMVEQSMKQNWWKGKLIRWSMQVGRQFRSGGLAPVFRMKLFIARILVLRLWRKKLGGRIRYMVVGAASLQPEIGKLFSAAGIFVVEGYGMTETAPFISVNRFEPGQNKFGTVGPAIPGVDIKIDQPNEEGEGEILVKGQNVMLGYFKRPELNHEVFTDEGWFCTGDVGKLISGRFLQITDRKKDIFKTSTGKYIAPRPLQNHFMQSPLIQRCLIIGFQKPFVTALIVPNFELLQTWCEQEHIHWTAPQFMVYNIRVRARYQQEVDELNESLPGYQRIRDFVLCHQDWTVESGELTTTLKPVRRLLVEHYQKEIDKMYA